MNITTGDLLFTQIGSADNLISAVTEGYRHALLNHVGVAVTNPRGTFVLEPKFPSYCNEEGGFTPSLV
jgi:hypothetical protein